MLITIGWIIVGGFTHASVGYSCMPEKGSDFLSAGFWFAIGQGSVKTIYSYLEYFNVCHLGGEIRNPGRNIPLSIIISILGIAALYY